MAARRGHRSRLRPLPGAPAPCRGLPPGRLSQELKGEASAFAAGKGDPSPFNDIQGPSGPAVPTAERAARAALFTRYTMSEFQREARFLPSCRSCPCAKWSCCRVPSCRFSWGARRPSKAIELAQSGYNKQMFLVAQREPDVEKPGADDRARGGRLQGPADAAPARRHHQGAVRRPAPCPLDGTARTGQLPDGHALHGAGKREPPRRARGPGAHRAGSAGRVRQEQQEADPGSAHVHHGPA